MKINITEKNQLIFHLNNNTKVWFDFNKALGSIQLIDNDIFEVIVRPMVGSGLISDLDWEDIEMLFDKGIKFYVDNDIVIKIKKDNILDKIVNYFRLRKYSE